jgi:hypothetical protein
LGEVREANAGDSIAIRTAAPRSSVVGTEQLKPNGVRER